MIATDLLSRPLPLSDVELRALREEHYEITRERPGLFLRGWCACGDCRVAALCVIARLLATLDQRDEEHQAALRTCAETAADWQR